MPIATNLAGIAHAVETHKQARAVQGNVCMTHRNSLSLFALGALAIFSCHNTWQGVKEDTHTAVQKTGEGVEKAGEKLEGAGNKKPATPAATASAAASGP